MFSNTEKMRSTDQIEQEKAEREEQYRAECEFRALKRDASDALMAYYGTAAYSDMRAAYADLGRVKNQVGYFTKILEEGDY